MQGFSILEDDPIYLEVDVPSIDGQFIGGIWYEGTPQQKVYEEFEGIWEPFTTGIGAKVLPQGVSSSDSLSLFTEKSLKTYSDLDDDASKADKVFITDPEDLSTASHPYIVYNKAPWVQNKGFRLLGGHFEYILIRQEKL